MPCVGLLVFLGCFTIFIAPDPEPMRPTAGLKSVDELPLTVIIDPGHGGNDEGAKRWGLTEKSLSLDIAQRMEKILQKANLPTLLTRREDVYMSLAERALIANQFNRSIFVSIHCNDTKRDGASGVETYFSDQNCCPNTRGCGSVFSIPPWRPLRTMARRWPATSRPP